MIIYEHPLNERIRALLRLEFLFQQIAHAMVESASTWESRTALQALLDVLEMTQHTEVKSQLIKELERQSTALHRLRAATGVNTLALDEIMAEVTAATERLHQHFDGWTIDAVRQIDFLSAIQRRSKMPGGTCRFDIPALHYWLQADYTTRHAHLERWLSPFLPMQEAIAVILRLTRNSGEPVSVQAAGGFFQKTLDGGPSPTQMVRVSLPLGAPAFPEISGGRQRITVRFLEQPDPNSRAVQSIADTVFELTCCTF